MDNYQYCAEYAHRAVVGRGGAKVLDFGCGAGQIVSLLRRAGVSAYGCDAFYGGGAYTIPAELTDIILPMQGNAIPFPVEMFDVVVNNQVMEHVNDLDAALSEIHRVLKPGGMLLSLFPDDSVWREGHCGVPFLHWFPKGSTARLYYAFCMRSVGFGQFTHGKSRMQWSKDFCDWLDKWTIYRPYDEIAANYGRYFSAVQHVEEHWLNSRVRARSFLPTSLKRFFVNKMVGLVFTCEKGVRTHPLGMPALIGPPKLR
jgi:SAM-dependent methyltransferase